MARYHDDKKQMHKYGRMIHEEMNKFANLPTEVMMKEWPKPAEYALNEGRIGNLFDGANHQMSEDSHDLRREKAHSKY